jgi:hypothetical protein
MQMQLRNLLDVLAAGAKLGALAGLSLLYGCGNPAEDAAAAAREAATEWQRAAAESDPEARLEIYRSVVADVEAIAADYAETPTGQAIAGGRSIGFLSLADMRAVRDDFAARAPCYADPSVECLTPFASRAFQGPAGDDSLIRINEIVCERGFAPAAAAIKHLEINKPEYAAQLWNIAYQAASCGNDEAVAAAIAAYIPANPTTGAERVNDLLQIVATEGVEAGWPAALRELEASLTAPGLDENTRATAALTMAVAYAGLGDARAAVAKYTYFTDTLGYAADLDSRRSLAARLILGGSANAGLPIARDTQGAGYPADALAIWAAHEAAAILGRRAGVIEDSSYLPNVILVDDVRDVLGPVEAAQAARHSSAAATVEGALDALAPSATVQNLGIGNPGLDGAYLILALVHQKAGDAAKANAAIGKVEALRGRLLTNPGLQARGLNERAVVRTYVALAQGKPDEAVGYAQDVGMKNYIGRPIALELARKGDAERALTVAGQFGVDLRSFQLAQPLVQALIEAGETEKAEQVIAALPMDANVRGAFYWDMVAKAAAGGDQDDAEEIATEHSLLNTPADRLRLLTLFLNSEEIAADRGDAEPIIREIFTIGRQLEAAGGERLIAQEAARQAFQHGHIDLGLELYRSAERKDQTPLFAAFRDGLRRSDLTAILVLAHDNLSGETRAYVIDAAIRHLNGNG